MKIAVSGTHCTGKTTVVEGLRRALPTYEVVDEPYHFLEDEGHEFAEMPSLADFELQLDRSIESIVGVEKDSIFDRCPADLLGYLLMHRDSLNFHVEHWLPAVRDAMRLIDLIVFVPIEEPDRLLVSQLDKPGLRRRVDEELREILLEDRWGFEVDVLEVTGTPGERVRQVLTYLNRVAE